MKYDVLMIGGGPAGYYCALRCAKGGLKVALVEREALGGTGFRWGCLPTKRMTDALKYAKESAEKMTPQDCNEDIRQIEDKMRKRLEGEKVHVYLGEGGFEDEHTFVIGDKVLQGRYVVIATGTSPGGLQNVKADGKVILTHREAIDLKKLPENMIIIGGDVEGCEFASIFARMGTKVTIVEKEGMLLPGNDRDLVQPLKDVLEKQGTKFYLGLGVKDIQKLRDKAIVVLENGQTIEGQKVLVTTGRKPNFPRGLEKTGVIFEHQKILVNHNLQTNIPHIYAIGDINGLLGMAHSAIQQGILTAENILSGKTVTLHYGYVPRAIFTAPEIAGTGFQEMQLKEKNMDYRVGRWSFKDTWRGFSKKIQEGFVKVIVGADDQLLEIWMVGPDVSELAGSLGIWMHHGIKTEDVKQNLLVHPSLSEAILEAILTIPK